MGHTEDQHKYSSAQVEDLVNSLPTYLSKRCIDMNGSRQKKNKDINEERQSADPNRKKRLYQRRGSLLQSSIINQIMQYNQEPPRVQEQYIQQLNAPILSEPGCSWNWPNPYDTYGPQGPTAVQMPENRGKFICSFCVKKIV